MNERPFYFYLLLLIIEIAFTQNICVDNENFCEKCHPLTNQCIKCITDNFIINEEGECTGRCKAGKNYCDECDLDEKLCKICQEGFYQDKVGGCSITPNCEYSYNGKCLQCDEDYILIGNDNSFRICKDKNSIDLKNCIDINNQTGLCNQCEDGYYLNSGDYKCSKTQNCYESIFGICSSCEKGYYLNKREEKCIKADEKLVYCKITLDGNNCDVCYNNYYLAEDGQCTNTVMCFETDLGKCIKCLDGVKLIKDNICTKEDNCNQADKDTGLCNSCISGYYIDNKIKKCISNQEDNEYKYCISANDGCRKCEEGYYLGEDLQCTKTEKCAESERNICNRCSKGYFLGYDHKCTKIEHCIYSGSTDEYPCDECEDNYYYNNLNQTCVETKDKKFHNCKSAITNDTFC